jgi:hypothetical protein
MGVKQMTGKIRDIATGRRPSTEQVEQLISVAAPPAFRI